MNSNMAQLEPIDQNQVYNHMKQTTGEQQELQTSPLSSRNDKIQKLEKVEDRELEGSNTKDKEICITFEALAAIKRKNNDELYQLDTVKTDIDLFE